MGTEIVPYAEIGAAALRRRDPPCWPRPQRQGLSFDIAGIHLGSYWACRAIPRLAIRQVLVVVIPDCLKGVKTLVAGI